PHGIAAPDRAALEDGGVDADLDLVVLGGGAQDARVFGQVPLRQRDHHTARAGDRDFEADLGAQGQRAPDPGVLQEALAAAVGGNDDVGPEAPDLEAAGRVELAEPVDGRGREHVDGGKVEEGAGRHGLVGDGVAVGQAVQVGPVLFEDG